MTGFPAPRVESDPDIVRSFLSDAAHVPGGFAAGVAFPRSVDEVAALVRSTSRVLPVGAQSSLTGGATPRGEVVLSTRGLGSMAIDRHRKTVDVGAGVPLSTLQSALAAEGLWYPPVPTYDGAFVGGTLSTNAAGAATFKYGTARDWVEGLTVVLADGTVLPIRRGACHAGAEGFAVEVGGTVLRVPAPTYTMPDVPKLSAGYFSRPGMDLVDLFVGSEGTLGVIVAATLRVINRPARCTVLIPCGDDRQALALTERLRREARRCWQGTGPLDVSAIEYMDARSLTFVADVAFARAGIARPEPGQVLLLVQLETGADAEHAIETLADSLTLTGITADPVVAMPGDDEGAARLFELREAVPTSVNAVIAAARQGDPEIQKTAGDFIVPFEHLAESVAVYRRAFESRSLDYAIWGHVSDGNLHPNAIPRTVEEMQSAREALVEMARHVIAMGGSPLAEHGVGRSVMKQMLLRELYGERGVAEMRAIKAALDPGARLAPGVLFSQPFPA